MKADWLILKTLLRRIGLLTIMLVGGVLIVRLYGMVFQSNPVAVMMTLVFTPMLGWFLGGQLGHVLGDMLRAPYCEFVPAYRRRVVRVSVVLGLALWALLAWNYAAGGFGTEPPAWLRWVPLWSYGTLGLGFIGGFLVFKTLNRIAITPWSRESWLRALTFLATCALPYLVAFNATFRNWVNTPLSDTLPGITGLALLCLWVGPLSWPVLIRLLPRVQPQTSEIQRDFQAHLRAGVGSAWGLPYFVQRLHRKGQTRIEFLVLQPTLLSLASGPLIAYGFLVGFMALWLLFNPKLHLNTVLEMSAAGFLGGMAALPITPLWAGTINAQRIGRSLLLPSQSTRSKLPRQIFARTLRVWIGGIFVGLAPALGFTLLLGISSTLVALVATALLWVICTAGAFAFFRLPTRTKAPPNDPVGLGVGMVLMLCLIPAKTFLFDTYTTATSLAVIALAFVVPWMLYQLGIHRWKTMEYGA